MTKFFDTKKLELKALKVRQEVLEMISTANASHIGSAFSSIETLVFLYEKILKENDRFILSKGWGVSALYSVMVQRKLLPKNILKTYCMDGSSLLGSATRNSKSGIIATTGSMGHGLPIGVGMALANKIGKKAGKVFVLMSDGECNEGSVWEAILQASHHKLKDLTVIVDRNMWQSFGRTEEVLKLEPLAKKWEAFNWDCIEIDGHSFIQLDKAFNVKQKKPTVIIAKTIKGKGVSYFEDKNEWHYKTPRQEILAIAKKELNL